MPSYAGIGDIQALNAQRTAYGVATLPTLAQVTLFIDQINGEIDSVLSAQGVAVPVVLPATFEQWLTNLNALGAAALAEMAKFPEFDGGQASSPQGNRYWSMYQDGLKRLTDGTAIPGDVTMVSSANILARSYLTDYVDGLEDGTTDYQQPAFSMTQTFCVAGPLLWLTGFHLPTVLVATMLFAAGLSALSHHVSRVLRRRAEKEMARSDAGGVVATVTDAHPVRDGAVSFAPGPSVCAHLHMVADSEYPVTSRLGRRPLPAAVAGMLVYLRPKTFGFCLARGVLTGPRAEARLLRKPLEEDRSAVGAGDRLLRHGDLHCRCATPPAVPPARGHLRVPHSTALRAF